jgi:hypothetical protein
MINASKPLSVGLLLVFLSACTETVPKEALQFTPETLAQRQLQTRRFETKEDKTLLSSGAAVLQDLGFTIERGATDLGFIAATKDLSAVEPAQVAGAVLLFLATAVVGAPVIMPVDRKQKVRVSLTTKRSDLNENDMIVRISFQRIVWNTNEKVTKTELLTDGKLYQEFFEKLSKAVFLDAHEF